MKTSDQPLINDLYLLSRRFLESHHQSYQRHILHDFMASRLGILIGQRGVGKTTFLIQNLLNASHQNPLSTEILYPCFFKMLCFRRFDFFVQRRFKSE